MFYVCGLDLGGRWPGYQQVPAHEEVDPRQAGRMRYKDRPDENDMIFGAAGMSGGRS